MATKPIKDLEAREYKARRKEKRHQSNITPARRSLLRNKDYDDLSRAQVKHLEAKDDRERVYKKKPKGMSDQEWRKQIESGEAMVQNALRSKRKSRGFLDNRSPKKVSRGDKNPQEFIITTVRDPKKKKGHGETKDQKAKRVLREMAAKKEGK